MTGTYTMTETDETDEEIEFDILDRDDVETPHVLQRGLDLCQKEDYATALRFLRATLVLHPNFTIRSNWWAGVCYEELGYHKEAMAAYEECLRIVPHLRDVQIAVAELRVRVE